MECDKLGDVQGVMKGGKGYAGRDYMVKGMDISNIGNIGKKLIFPTKLVGFICAVAIVLLFPIYCVARMIFRIAVLRDNKSIVLENKIVKLFVTRLGTAIKVIKNNDRPDVAGEPGKGFSEFKKEMEYGRQWFNERKKERITVTSYDGIKLVAYYLPAEVESDKAMILMHGYRNDGLWDFSGLVEFYHSMGYHLLVPHQRSHGESEGTYICYGVKERYDLKQWTEYVVSRFDGKCDVFLSGISMGGATVLMAASLELPCQVKGIIADCALTSSWDIFSHVMKKDYHLQPVPFLYAVDYICRSKAGFGLKECNTVSCMKNNRIPVLFIHGGKDVFVPTEMSYKNYEACAAPKEILIVDEAAHGTSCFVEPDIYQSTVIKFMEKWKAEKEPLTIDFESAKMDMGDKSGN